MNKVIWITGAGSGIGATLAKRALATGYRVVGSDINQAGLAKLEEECSAYKDSLLTVQHDVTKEDQWQKTFNQCQERFQQLDILMNVAGYLRAGTVEDFQEVDVDRHLDINVKGTILGTLVAGKHFKQKGYGHIINVSSHAGLMPISGNALYSASKYAVRSFTLSLASELYRAGVAISLVCPGPVATPMLEQQCSMKNASLTFFGRVTSPEDLADHILGKVLKKRPLESYVPVMEGIAARIGDLFPKFAQTWLPFMYKRGRAAQAKYALKGAE